MTAHLIPSLMALSIAMLSSVAIAQNETGLPPEQAVERAIEDHPVVQAALARTAAARETARGLRAGPHEFVVSGSVSRRSIQSEGDFAEFDATLERGIRLPGRARLDRLAGGLGITSAGFHLAETRHRMTLLLNSLWWDWLAAASEVRGGDTAVNNLAAALTAVERRVELLDAAIVDADHAGTALATAQVSREQARARATVARSRLEAQFPTLPLPDEAPALPTPTLPNLTYDALREQIIIHSSDMAGARAEADLQRVLAQRAERDRIADPTLGLRLFSERAGAERGVGVVASIPIGGTGRSAAAARMRAEATASEADYAATRFTAEETAASDIALANSYWRAWQLSVEARQSAESAAHRLRQGYRLGGVDLTDLLYAERQAQEAVNGETVARADALRAIAKMRIDADDLWAMGHHAGLGEPQAAEVDGGRSGD